MTKNSKNRSRLTKLLALGCVMAVFASVFAFFTDRLVADSTAVAGNIDLVWEDTSVKGNSNNAFAIDDAWDNKKMVSDGNIINPGDYFDLSYTLTNTGSKSMDVRQRIVLTSTIDMTNDAEEYQLTITGGNNSVAIVPSKPDAKTLVYDFTDIILDGSKEAETGAVSGAYTVRLDFAKEAKNIFMDSQVNVNLYAAAKQHRNTVDSDFPAFTEIANIMSNANWETK